MIETSVGVPTAAGHMDTFVCHPERHGPHPVVIFYMDAPGIREELYDMARRLATVGYYVALPNLYYRHGVGTTAALAASDPKSPEFQRMFRLMESLSNSGVADDTGALLAWLEGQSAARPGKIGTVGYCMSGPFVVVAAARFPERVAAAASIHGVALVTDAPDSPHRLGMTVCGELYFAWAEHDQYAPLAHIEPLTAAYRAAGARFEIELYRGADHGFVFPTRYAYRKADAERHWERVFDLFRRTLD